MGTIPIFNMGDTASASLMNQAFNSLEAQGNSILDKLSNIQLTTLVDYQRALTSLNSKQQRSYEIMPEGTLVQFLVSDFDSIDQGNSTATIRVDNGAANLREIALPSQVLVGITSFSSSVGTIQPIDAESTLFSVYSPSSIPTGTFLLTLASTESISLLTINISAMASSPDISVSVSENNLSWTPANQIIVSGTILNCWFSSVTTKYIKLQITPTHPDNLGGNTYTFGVTDLSGAGLNYSLVSDVFFLPQVFSVSCTQVQLVGNNDANILYYLTLDNGNPADLITVVAVPNTPISLPGISAVSSTETTSSGVLGTSLPSNHIIHSVTVFDSNNNELPVIPGLSVSDPNISALTSPRVSLVSNVLTVLPHPPNGTSYTVNYLTGTNTITATLRVHMSTSDNSTTPIFNGATLEEV